MPVALAALAAALLLAGVVPAAGGVAPPARATRPAAHASAFASTAVGIGAREFRLAVYRTRVPHGTVRFNVVNYGEDKHDLVVRDAHGRRLAASGEIGAGARVVVRVHLRPGVYRLRCEIADHASRGMRASILVR